MRQARVYSGSVTAALGELRDDGALITTAALRPAKLILATATLLFLCLFTPPGRLSFCLSERIYNLYYLLTF